MIEERGPLPKVIAIDIMLQITCGVCYMHDMKATHCDLQLDNFIINLIDVPKVNDIYVHVKLYDFSISKVEVKDNL